jgi:superfamily II DNA or RNA helicase
VIESQPPGFTALLASLSRDALTRGKQFERLVKWWLTQDPIWSRKIKSVWLWDEWPDYPGRDIGIDLVAKMTDGTLCAVQAKCFDENRDIPKSELDSFISAASQRAFQHRLLVATTDGLSANARRMLADQHVVRVMRSDLESSLEVWPASIDELSAPAQPHATPRPHQNLAITDVTNGFEGNSRGQLIMACGTGKTLTALWIKETLKPKTTLVLVPSLNLLAQTLSEWAKNSLSPWQYLCVCSDDTVNKLEDQPISTVGDLPFEVTTNPADIAKFLSLGGERIIFSTYQSSAQVAKAQEQSGVSFDLVICDEAHRLTGKTDADYATVLDEKKIVGQKRLFMTATPRTYTTAAKTKAEDRGVEITSMDDEQVYGPVLHKLSFGEAIKQDLLSDYRVLIVGVTDPQVQDLIDRRELVSVNDSVNTDARTLAAHIGLAKATKDYNLKRTISFHSRIKSADQFAKDHLKILDWLPDTHKPSGETWTGTISGAMNTGDRRRLIKQLSLDGEDRHALLTNARCLTEGVDVPSLDGVAFIDPRSSQVDIIQAVGRAIRKSKNKEIGTIVLPVLIPTDSDAEEALENTAFKPIWAILNALKSHDDDFAIELNNLRTELGRTGEPGDLPNRLVEDLPTDIDSLLPGFSNKLSVSIVEHATSSWDWWFGKLLNHVELNGDAKVVRDKKDIDPLATWVSTQRTDFKRQVLSTNKINLLENLPGWTWEVHSDRWDETFSLLTDFLEANNNRYPLKGEGLNGIDLGGWVSRQRMSYANADMDKSRASRLEGIPNWDWDPDSSRWDEYFQLLLSYSLKTSRTSFPAKLVLGGLDVGRWMTYQRVLMRQNKLADDRIVQFQSLRGWNWNPDEDNWNAAYKSLRQFQAEHGHCLVHSKHKQDEIPLGRWVTNQRVKYRKNQLEETRIKLLESLEGWNWGPRDDEWETAYKLLVQFSQREGYASPLNTHKEDGFSLGGWVSRQRGLHKLGELDNDLVIRLQGLPGWEWTGDLGRAGKTPRIIEPQLSLAVINPEIIDEFNINANRPFSPENLTPKSSRKIWWICRRNPEHQWRATVSNRTQKKSGCPHCRDTKEIGIQLLQQFISREGHSRVPSSHLEEQFALGQWVSNRRSLFNRGQLNTDEKKRLEDIPGWEWSPRKRANETGIQLLQQFISREGHSRVPSRHLEEQFALGQWVSRRRTSYARGKMLSTEQHQLEKIPGWTWTNRE